MRSAVAAALTPSMAATATTPSTAREETIFVSGAPATITFEATRLLLWRRTAPTTLFFGGDDNDFIRARRATTRSPAHARANDTLFRVTHPEFTSGGAQMATTP